MRRHLAWVSGAVVAAVVGTAVGVPGTAAAFDSAHTGIVSDVSQPVTPQLLDGTVLDLAQVGNRIIVAGTFTQVQDSPENGGAAMAQPYVLAFDEATGRLDRNFDPQLDNEVHTIQPGPNNTVYLGGRFSTLNGATARRLVQVSLLTGDRVTAFAPPAINGIVDDIGLSGGRLFAGGTFTSVGGVAYGGLVAFNATTGARTSYMGIDVAGHHNYPTNGPVSAPVGVDNFDISPDGARMVAIGNFTSADGLPRDQAVMIRLGSTSATVDPNWRTNGYDAVCLSVYFDSYVRDVQFSPDGSYFGIVASGSGYPGTLCDTLTRWETSTTGQDVKPTWVSYTGGDSMFSIAITGSAIYVGGHQRWANNPTGGNYASAGAVPRPGIAAHDPRTGIPLAWNPGRNPRGVGAEALLATTAGLYVGMDTQYLGNREVYRPGLAFWPLAGGTSLPSENTGTLPANVVVGGPATSVPTGPAPTVLYRVNAGGPEVAATDGGPAWAADADDNPLRTAGATVATTVGAPGEVDGTVPASTPAAVWDDERSSTGTFGAPGMSWAFPVAAGTTVDVRLYFADHNPATTNAGARLFNVAVEGATKLNFYDVVGDVGHDVATMKSFTVTPTDDTLNVDLVTLLGSPFLDAIEVVESTGGLAVPVGADDALSRWHTGTTAGADHTAPAGGLQWSKVRGAFMAGDQLIYGYPSASGDYFLYQRSFDGAAYGDPKALDPYNDPKWSDVPTGTWWGTIPNLYRGQVPNFYDQLPSVSSMFFANGVLYYTRTGFPGLYSRGFSLDSGVVGAEAKTVVPTGFSDMAGAFLSGGRLFWAVASTGELRSTPWNDGAPNPAGFDVRGGPSVDGRSWASHALFIAPGRNFDLPNTAPVATLTPTCVGLVCSFSSAGSHDPDGSIASYAWDFGDGATSTEANPSHTYATSNNYNVTLTVTDAEGAATPATRTVPAQTTPGGGIALRGSSGVAGRTVTSLSVTVPSDVQAGDALVLILATSSTATGTPPAGWTLAGSQLSGTGPNTQVFRRVAAAGDAGAAVPIALSASSKATAQLLAYSGTAAGNPIASVVGSGQGAGTSHATPSATAAPGSWVLSVWADKSSAARTWTAPGGVSERSNLPGVGSGDVATLVADSGAPVSGPVGNLAATVPTADTRAVTLTVVLAPNVATPPPATGIAVRGATGRIQRGVTTTSVTVPAGVQAGDGLVLVLATNGTATGTTPSGWTLVGTRTAGTTAVTTQVFQRVATASTAGSTVSVRLSASSRVSLQLVAYSGTSAAGPVESMTTAATGAVTAHQTPSATAAAGNWVLSVWTDRQTLARTFTPPSGVTVRSNLAGGTGGDVATLVADSGAAVAGGAAGGLTATVPTVSQRGTTVTLVIRPA